MLFWRATLAWVILYSCASAVEFCAFGQGKKRLICGVVVCCQIFGLFGWRRGMVAFSREKKK